MTCQSLSYLSPKKAFTQQPWCKQRHATACTALLLGSLLARISPNACFQELTDQHVHYHYLTGDMLIDENLREMNCHIFLTLYTAADETVLRGFFLPNEHRHQGCHLNLFLSMPEDVESWDPHLRVTFTDNSTKRVATTKWLSWADHTGCRLGVPMTFSLTMNTDKAHQLKALHVADWDPIGLDSDVGQVPSSPKPGVIMVYAHLRGQITQDKVSLLHIHVTYHHRIGVEQFWLYASPHQIADLITFQDIQALLESEVLQLIMWPDVFCEHYSDCIETNGHHYKHQILVYNAAALAGIHARKALLLLDTDEFLVVPASGTYMSAVDNLVHASLSSHAQAVIPRFDSFTCRNWDNDSLPDIRYLQSDPESFLNQFTSRSQTPHTGYKGKSLFFPEMMAVYEVHFGVAAQPHKTCYQSQDLAFILHLVNLWSRRVCGSDIPFESIPTWSQT